MRVDVLRRLRHDLGKYIAMQSRWATDDELAEVLISDLLQTHRSGEQSTSACALWDALLPELQRVDPDAPELSLIRGHMKIIATFAVDSINPSDLRVIRDSAVAVSDLTRDWYRRAAKEEHG